MELHCEIQHILGGNSPEQSHDYPKTNDDEAVENQKLCFRNLIFSLKMPIKVKVQ